MPRKKPTKKQSIRSKAAKGLFDLFVPHKDNGFHPHFIRPLGLSIVVLVAVASYMVGSVPKAGSVKGASDGMSRQVLLEESNKARQEAGVPLLNVNNDLNSAASLKARDMLVQQYWAHNAPDGTTPWYWFREVNYRYDFAGENLAKGFTNPTAVVTAWMNSPEHRHNLLSGDYEDVGFGVMQGTLNGEQTTIVVALYGSKVGAPTLTESKVLAAEDGQLNLVTRFGVGLQSLNPTTLGSIGLLLIAAIVSLFAHAFRKQLPKPWQRSWKRHHGLYKSVAMACLILVLITLYGGGQIL